MELLLEITKTAWSWMMENLLYINLILSVVIVFFQRRDPKAVWTWLLALYFLPIFGFFLYLMLCQDFRKSKMFRIKEGAGYGLPKVTFNCRGKAWEGLPERVRAP